MGAKPPILEVLRIVRRNSDFGVSKLLLIFLKLRRNSDFGVFAVGAKPPILEFLCTQNLRFWSIKNYYY